MTEAQDVLTIEMLEECWYRMPSNGIPMLQMTLWDFLAGGAVDDGGEVHNG